MPTQFRNAVCERAADQYTAVWPKHSGNLGCRSRPVLDVMEYEK